MKHARRVEITLLCAIPSAERLTIAASGSSLTVMTSSVTPLITPGTARYDVAATVRAHLAVRRISDSALARAIGISQSMMSRRVNGDIAFDTDDLGRIASYLGLTLVELIQMPTAGEAPRPGATTGPRAFYFGVGPAGFEPTTSTV